MRISVKVKDVVVEMDDNSDLTLVKYEPHNKEIQKILKIMCEEAIKILKERES
jgi:hypothetical protein